MPKFSSAEDATAKVVRIDQELTRRLDALDSGLAFLVRTTHRMFWRVLEKRLAEHGVTPEMWTYLRVLWREEGLSQKRLAERLNLEGPTVGTALRIMEKRGLVTRKRNAKDGREWCIYLKPRARNLERKLLPIAEQTNAAAKAGMKVEQITAVQDGLRHMQRNLRKLTAMDGNVGAERAVPRSAV